MKKWTDSKIKFSLVFSQMCDLRVASDSLTVSVAVIVNKKRDRLNCPVVKFRQASFKNRGLQSALRDKANRVVNSRTVKTKDQGRQNIKLDTYQ